MQELDQVAKLSSALRLAARVVEEDRAAAGIFRRIEKELARAEAQTSDDPVVRARALLAAE